MRGVSILGGGWLGLPLALELAKQNFSVQISSTTSEKLKYFRDLGLNAFNIELDTENEIDSEFWSEVLVICIPPGRYGNYLAYSSKLQDLLRQMPDTVKQIILISSTSVYPKTRGNWNENAVYESESEPSTCILIAEQLVLNSHPTVVILRMAGLAGYDRNPSLYGTGKLNGNEPVNMVHRDDSIAVIKHFIEHKNFQGIFNVCAPEHPLRIDYYAHGARAVMQAEPQLPNSENPVLRVIDSNKLIQLAGYSFLKPSPVHFWDEPSV
jgi:nucleoside-diphosphate-sugar epimerase